MERTMRIVKGIMPQQDTLGIALRGKTGWASAIPRTFGWYTGWVERTDGAGPFIFMNRHQCADTSNRRFASARRVPDWSS